MKSILLALVMVLTVGSVANADDIFDWLDRRQAVTATVDKHKRADDPVEIRDIPLTPIPPYIATQVLKLRGEAYRQWARMWNAYQDQVARRGYRERTVYGSTTNTTRTTNGTVTRITPRFWTYREGVPGEIRYNPYVEPK